MESRRIGRHSLLKTLNHRAVVELLAAEGPRSRVEIAEYLTLSQASVSRIVDSLLQAGLVREGATVTSRPGRPQVRLGIDPNAACVAAVDLRPGRLRVRLADLAGGSIREEEHVPVTDDAAAVAEQIVRVVAEAHAALADDALACTSPGDGARADGTIADPGCRAAPPLLALVVGLSAAWDERARRVYAARNLLHLEGVDLLGLLGAGRKMAVRVDNDVNLAALGEMSEGVAQGHQDFFYLSLGAGVGGAAVVGGVLHRGGSGFGGELGYLPVLLPDGETRDLERLVSRGALERRLRGAGIADDVEAFLEREPASRAEEAVWDEIAERLCLALCAVATTLDPPLFVLGGSLGPHLERLVPRLSASVAATLPVTCEVATTTMGRDAALVGAVSLAIASAREQLVQRELGNEEPARAS